MKTRNTILSGIAIALVALLAIPMIYADTTPGGTVGENTPPKAWVLKKCFDLCDDNEAYDTGYMNGGSVPGDGDVLNPGEDVQNAGCVDFGGWKREGNYLFSGEQIGFLAVARDLDGAEDIVSAYLYVDTEKVVKCNVIDPASLEKEVGGTCATNGGTEGNCAAQTTKSNCEQWAATPYNCVWVPTMTKIWCNHNVEDVLHEYPTEWGESAGAGFNPTYDKLYKCVLTATDGMCDPTDLTVTVTDEAGDSGDAQVEKFCFNPEIAVSIDVSDGNTNGIQFETGTVGDLVYSTNGLVIENDATCEVAMGVWLGGHDWVAQGEGAKCPESNVLDVDKYMQYRCELNDGTYIDQVWKPVNNKNLKTLCDAIGNQCFGLEPALNHDGLRPNDRQNVLLNGQEIKCLFKLQIPTPICVGGPFEGDFLTLIRAI